MAKEPDPGTTPPPGPGVDASGNPVIDPSKNVLDLVDAAILRQDDLRHAERTHIREVLELRQDWFQDELRCAHEREDLRARYQQELRESETGRLNAIRQVDVEAVQRAAEVQATQQATLAQQVATSAETLRTQVAAAAQAAQIALAAALEPIMKDIADLRRAQYEAQGQKINVVEQQAGGGQRGMWIGVAIAGAVGFLSLLGVVVAVVVAVTS